MNDHKRHASTSLLDGEDEMLKKRHCSSDKSYEESETSGSTEKRCEAVQSVCVDKNGVCAKGSCEDLVLRLNLNTYVLYLNLNCYLLNMMARLPLLMNRSSFNKP